MKEELLRFKRRQKYLIVDTETEGLNLIKSRPWQCAWITAENGRVTSRNDRFIKWDNLKVSPDAARITGFSMEEYERRAEDPQVVWDDFSKLLYDPEYKVIGQNFLGFDAYMVNVWGKGVGLEPDYSYLERVIDTKSLAAAIAKQILPDMDNFLAWQYKMLHIRERGLKTSQAHLLKSYNIDHDPKRLHDALYDIEMTYQVFLKQIYDIEV